MWSCEYGNSPVTWSLLLTISKRCLTTQQWVLHHRAQEYTMLIPTQSKDLHPWGDCVDGFIRVVKQIDKIHIVPVGATVGPAHVVLENAAWCGIH
jgi:hypothetical protein